MITRTIFFGIGISLFGTAETLHYVECLDCGEILEVGEIKIPGAEDESLSDA